jgi:hypothetical protein
MEDDLIDSAFAGLDVYYPGSKRKRRDVVKPEPKVQESWDSKPYIKTLPSGKDIEMFAIGALAQALGRPLITIRAWFKWGYLPESPYRLPTKKDKTGVDRKGRRLYTRPMIEAAISIFTRNGLMDNPRIDWSKHPTVAKEIADAWDNLIEQ